jgi:nicotinamide-nucleotide amidase
MDRASAGSYSSEIIVVGDEILRGDVVNANATYIGRALSEIGLPPHWSSVIPDDKDRIVAALAVGMHRSQVVILTGGLGPTPDDLTREAVAGHFGLRLEERPDLLQHVQELFRSRGMVMPETSRNQAWFPVGAGRIPNAHGTATGIHIQRDGRHVFALPGVSIEMQQMVDSYVVPALRTAFPDALLLTRTLRLAGIGESLLLQRLGDQSEIVSRVSVAYLPHHGLLDLRLTARSRDLHEAEAQIAHAESLIREQVGDHIYATGTDTLAAVIGNILVNRGQKLATAESCTGGLVASMITDTPGSSCWFERGWVTYSNTAKSDDLEVPVELISEHGAVSERVARAMADGARRQSSADWGLACTGIAGPEGGTPEKPVGTVWVAVSSASETVARHLKFSGLRETIKLRTAHCALAFLHNRLIESRI